MPHPVSLSPGRDSCLGLLSPHPVFSLLCAALVEWQGLREQDRGAPDELI